MVGAHNVRQRFGLDEQTFRAPIILNVYPHYSELGTHSMIVYVCLKLLSFANTIQDLTLMSASPHLGELGAGLRGGIKGGALAVTAGGGEVSGNGGGAS